MSEVNEKPVMDKTIFALFAGLVMVGVLYSLPGVMCTAKGWNWYPQYNECVPPGGPQPV